MKPVGTLRMLKKDVAQAVFYPVLKKYSELQACRSRWSLR